ncbi:MAG TPA: hypothetical protein VF041_06915 [Gemmatimonadaceae bacterium]
MRRRPDGSLVVSVVLHILLGAALVWVLSIPVPFQSWMHPKGSAAPEERITYVAVPSGAPATPGRSGGDGRPVAPGRRRAPLVAPGAAPRAVPPPPATGVPADTGGSGPVVGAGGLRQGIVPSFEDPRVWLPPGAVYSPPKAPAERLDSALAARLRVHNDSMAAIAANAGRAPGDWTFEKNGKKWGIDQKKIYIGDHSIPTALLALLPLNKQANPIALREGRTLELQRADIAYQAQRAMNEEDFNKAVKQIRERKQREHDAEMKRKQEEKKKAAQKVIAEP